MRKRNTSELVIYELLCEAGYPPTDWGYERGQRAWATFDYLTVETIYDETWTEKSIVDELVARARGAGIKPEPASRRA